MQRLIEDDGIALLVTFDAEPTEAEIEDVKEICRWVAEDHSRINLLLPKARIAPMPKGMESEPIEAQVETLNRMRREILS